MQRVMRTLTFALLVVARTYLAGVAFFLAAVLFTAMTGLLFARRVIALGFDWLFLV